MEELIRQGNTNLCLLFSILNVLESEEDRRKFLMSHGKGNDLTYITQFIKSLPHHQEKKEENKKKKAVGGRENEVEEFPHGLMLKDIVEYCKHLKKLEVLRSWRIKISAFSLENMLMPSKFQANKGKAFLLTGATTTNKDKISKRVNSIVRQRESLVWSEGEDKGSRKRKREEVEVEYCKSRCQAQRMSIKFDEPNKLPTTDYTQHAIGMKYVDEQTLMLADPGKRVWKKILVEDMQNKKQVEKAVKTITESLVDVYGVWSFNLEFA